MSKEEMEYLELFDNNIRSHKQFIVAATDILDKGPDIPELPMIVEFAGQMSKAWTETIKAGVVQDIADSIRELSESIRESNS